MNDIVKRLREDYCNCHEAYKSRGLIDPQCDSCNTKAERHEAADRIEQLERELAEAREKALLDAADAAHHAMWQDENPETAILALKDKP